MDPVEDNTYDILIEGTGLAQSILAAAISRISKKVIHIDKNTFYGGSWAALSIDQLDEFITTYASSGTPPFPLSIYTISLYLCLSGSF